MSHEQGQATERARPEPPSGGAAAPEGEVDRRHDEVPGEATSGEAGQEVEWDLDPNWPFDDTPYTLYQRLDYAVDRSIRYHGLREAFFDKTHRLIQVVSFVTTTTAVVALFGEEGMLGQVLAAIAALGQAFDMFFNLEQNSKEHRTLRARFQSLRGDMSLQPATHKAVRQWMKQRADIEAEEGPTRAVLNALAANAAMKARDVDHGQLLHIGPLQVMLAQFVDLWPDRITVNERRPKWLRMQARRNEALENQTRSLPER